MSKKQQDKVKAAFLADLAKNPYDEATRKIFADWLEEADEPEEADWHRRWWTPQRQQALDHFTTFAKVSGLTVEQVMEEADEAARLETAYGMFENHSVARQLFTIGNSQELFWHCYQIVREKGVSIAAVESEETGSGDWVDDDGCRGC